MFGFSNTNITTIPFDLEKLINLQGIGLEKTKVSKLPETIGNLTKLEIIKAANSKLSTLPKNLSGLNKLTHLDIAIKQVPDTIELTKFRSFRNQNNSTS